MTAADLIGWAAAAMTLLAFTSRDVRLLRLASLGASVAFITFGAATETWPVLALHAVLLPINLMRLLELGRARPSDRKQDPPGKASANCACGKTPARPFRPCSRLSMLALVFVPGAMPAAATPPYADRMHARAVESFRQGRFPEAYGRFIGLPNAGHPASARYALWMCEQGLVLFGKDWDCAPHEMEDWARSAGMTLPPVAARQTATPVGAKGLPRR